MNLFHGILLAFSTGCMFFSGKACAGEETSADVYRDAVAAYQDGRPEDAKKLFESDFLLETTTSGKMNALTQLGVLNYETGAMEESLDSWQRAEKIDNEDVFAKLQKGWCLFSMERYDEAKPAFDLVPSLTTEKGMIYDSLFASALSLSERDLTPEALKLFQSLYVKNPYALSADACLIGELLADMGQEKSAKVFFQQALGFDSRNFMAEAEMAKIFENENNYVAAWQIYSTLNGLDPYDETFSSKTGRLLKKIKGDSANLRYWTRIKSPLQKEPRIVAPSDSVTVGLYADENGRLSPLVHFEFISPSSFTARDEKLGVFAQGESMTRWSVQFDKTNGMLEVRDPSGALVYNGTRTFTIEPESRGSTILIKNAEADSPGGVDMGDKELRGSLVVRPSDKGALLTNRVEIENLLPGIAALEAQDEELESLKAVAVALRTKLIKRKAEKAHEKDGFDVCDSGHCLLYRGIQAESVHSIAAVDATAGEILFQNGKPAQAEIHAACGGLTEEGVRDDNSPEGINNSPADLYQRIIRAPSDALYCAPTDATNWASARWTYVFDARSVEKKANRLKKIGRLKGVIPLRLSNRGAIMSARFAGTKGNLEISDWKQLSYLLGSGTLRSNLFVIRPVYKGKYPLRFIVTGVGTGNGHGLCAAGAAGMARQGKLYREILAHYFPNYTVTIMPTAENTGQGKQ